MRFLAIDEEGYFVIDGLRMADQEHGKRWLSSLTVDPQNRIKAIIDNTDVFVEAFDEPLVAHDIVIGGKESATSPWLARFPYEYTCEFDPQSLRADDWDRFHGRTKSGVPFLLNRGAQSRLFQSATAFDDDSMTFGDLTISAEPLYSSTGIEKTPEFWNKAYLEGKTPFDRGAPHPQLDKMISPLKLSRSRVLVLGCGAGHDAWWWHQRGHIVTGVDFSSEAIAKARARYGEPPDLKWMVADAFTLPASFNSSFDIIFEHTFFCAIDPFLRNKAVELWYRLLIPRGQLLGFFATIDRWIGPPFGTTEWEIRQRLLMADRKSSRRARFQPLIWKRMQEGSDLRVGGELFLTVEKTEF